MYLNLEFLLLFLVLDEFEVGVVPEFGNAWLCYQSFGNGCQRIKLSSLGSFVPLLCPARSGREHGLSLFPCHDSQDCWRAGHDELWRRLAGEVSKISS